MLIDSHAHIYLDSFKSDITEVVDRALAAGVGKILLPNIDGASTEKMLELEEKFPTVCYAMMGLHPCSVKEDFEKQLREVEEWLNKRSFLAVGEIGTDLYWDKAFWEQQKEAFRIQCELALVHHLPIVIHCRETIDETILLVKEFEGRGLRGVFHCFTGSEHQARQITDMGFYLGLGGISTFKNVGMNAVIPKIDRTKIILETDSPYLSPVPFRGQRNEPARIKVIAEKIADYCGVSYNELTVLTTNNTNKSFFPSRTIMGS